jgi:hypothetical protein
MTRLVRRNHGRGHSYLLDGEKVPGVTTIIGDTLAKKALTRWAARTAASFAVDRWDELAGEPLTRRLELIGGAPWAERNALANRGTEVHDLADQLAHGQQIDVPEELKGFVDAYLAYTYQLEPVDLISEAPVAHTGYWYAGTLDLITRIRDRILLVDLKTSSGIWPDHALQLAAYEHCDLIQVQGEERPMPEVDGCAVLRLAGDGTYELRELETERSWLAFQYLLGVHRWQQTEPIGEEIK